MKYFKTTGQSTTIFEPSQTTLSWFPMPQLEFNLSHKLTKQLLNSPPGNRRSAGTWGSRLVFKTYRPIARKLNNSTSVSPGNLRCLQDNLHGSFAGHTGYTSSSSTSTKEARGTALYRLRLPLSTNVIDIDPSEIQEYATGLSAHSSEHLSPTKISLENGDNINTGLRIYTDVSETEKGVGAAFCVLTDINITHRWSTSLSLRSTVFQAEILALLKAVEFDQSLCRLHR
ncbi:hypothetical protein AVEN_115045-1 [Araneus ventricosus]|uniref:RNase H type-1 domain-containing protein n=1 Tax=Araneus ventricosus TaxID=182803 RepID=A0A4Y1ZX16_ARAVE|nr:hypothetical protein AVEN_115045-1 [Araneus ventricosus]